MTNNKQYKESKNYKNQMCVYAENQMKDKTYLCSSKAENIHFNMFFS